MSLASGIGTVCICLLACEAAFATVVVSLSSPDETASETPADQAQFLISRLAGSTPQAATIFYRVSGTATAGADYAALGGFASLAANQDTVSVFVNVQGDDGLFEGDETVTLTLFKFPNQDITITEDTATISILDTLHAVTASTLSDADEASTTAGRALIAIGALNASGSAITVEFSVSGTATPGADYAILGGTAIIPVDSSSATVDVKPVADDLLEGDETVVIELTSTSDTRLTLGNPAAAIVDIVDDEAVADDDSDGVANIEECPDVESCRDTDGDTVPDYQDPDDDGDGVPSTTENAPTQDTDDDGTPDYLDDNDDGDGRPTRDEDEDADGDGNPATDPTDIDDDGIADYLDPEDQGGPDGDLDGDGLTNERETELGTDPENADSDGDGVGDGDEVTAETDPLDHRSFTDADGDLVPDAVELAEDTNPGDADSFLDTDGGGTADHIETVAYPSFGIPASDVLDDRDDQRDTDGDGLPDRLEIAIGAAPDDVGSPTANGGGDDTGNGISNAIEDYLASIGIDNADVFGDFDRDGYPDAAEVRFGTDPLRAAAGDVDRDGVPDVVERLAGVDIDAGTDTDGDAVPDARELALGSNPLDANSPLANGGMDDDADGISNAVEHVLQLLGAADDTAPDSDTDADELPDADEIRAGTDPLRDEQPAPWIELAQNDAGRVRALRTNGGPATARAVFGGHQTGTLTYDWGESDPAVLAVASGSQTAAALMFSPTTLPAGAYTLMLRMHRSVGAFNTPMSVVGFTFNVLGDTRTEEVADSDGDGIPDSSDDSDARRGFANTLQGRPGGQSGELITATPGVRLQLGDAARLALLSSARVTEDEAGAADDDFAFGGGIYDFDVTNLPQPGSVVRIVLPQLVPIGEFAQYRKFSRESGWGDFVEDTNNRVESAPASNGACPEPGNNAYGAGLTPGHLCVQLSIEDGGPNDGDASRGPNGIIKDPGGVATPRGQINVGQGGGGVTPAPLLILGLLALLTMRRRRTFRSKAMPHAGAVLCACVVAMPSPARADAFFGVGAGLSLLDPDADETAFVITDDEDQAFKIFGGAELTTLSRNLSARAFLVDLGEARIDNSGSVDYGAYGAALSYGLGNVNLPRWSGFVSAGVSRLDVEANAPLNQENDTSLYLGVGASFALTRNLFLQLEYESFAQDAQFLSLNLVQRFRARPRSRVRTTPLPDE